MDSFDLVSERQPAPYDRGPDDARETYLEDISTRALDYQDLPPTDVREILDQLPAAYERFERKCDEIGFNTGTRILVQISDSDVIRLDVGSGWSVRDLGEETHAPGYVLIDCDKRLLLQILKGPRFAHWNNAEIGSHLRFVRDPDRFERGCTIACTSCMLD